MLVLHQTGNPRSSSGNCYRCLQGTMVCVTSNSLIKPRHALDMYHLSQLGFYGATPISRLYSFLSDCRLLATTATKALKTYYFYNETPINRSYLHHKRQEEDDPIINSTGLCVYLRKLSKLQLTQPWGSLRELVHGSKVGFSMQKAHWGVREGSEPIPGASKNHTRIVQIMFNLWG